MSKGKSLIFSRCLISLMFSLKLDRSLPMNLLSKCLLSMSLIRFIALRKSCGDKGLILFGSNKEIKILNFSIVLPTQGTTITSFTHSTSKRKLSLLMLIFHMLLPLAFLIFLVLLTILFFMQTEIFFILIASGLQGTLSNPLKRRRLELPYLGLCKKIPGS